MIMNIFAHYFPSSQYLDISDDDFIDSGVSLSSLGSFCHIRYDHTTPVSALIDPSP